MPSDNRDMLWTPDGVVPLGGKALNRVELKPALIEWLVQFSTFAEWQRIGLHCADCGKDIIGKNGSNDRIFSAACSCREWVGGNRDYVEPVMQ